MHDAAREAQRHGTHAAAAAVAKAAHDVLREYFSQSAAGLDADLAASLAKVPNGTKEDAGVAIGAAAADAMIASRADDGRDDPQYVYTKTAAIGVWPAAPVPGGMALPWLGFVDPVVDVEPVALDGPDPDASAAFATDYEEARTLGPIAGTSRTQAQTDVALFFSANPMLTYRNAFCDYLGTEPLGLLPTTRLFARIDAAMATTFIETWRMKYEIGFWRPDQAVEAVPDRRKPGYQPPPGGLGAARRQPGLLRLHERARIRDLAVRRGASARPWVTTRPLLLKAGTLQRPYATLTALEHDALNARIWGGLHFRDSMEDTYFLGHTTADQVMSVVH